MPKVQAGDLPEAVREVIRKIVEGYDPEKIIIFGSYARGDARPDSDLDVLVVKDTEERWIDRVVEVSLLCTPRVIPMDILVKTPDEVQHMLDRRSLFMHTIMNDGVIAHERKAG
ncbi:MAG: nucleotidyltransferase domain-containing protein [candidate division WS1 bacterium]|jgi:predicted nucleotidyltransferase|nr:nucleotidyltransferase domain-containing protein [candidate division WS1 bacterium]